MGVLDLIGWAFYALLLAGIVRLGTGARAPRGLERLDYRR